LKVQSRVEETNAADDANVSSKNFGSPFDLFLVKLSPDEGFEFGNGLLCVRAANIQGQFAAGAGGEHHQAHDAFAIDFFTVLFDVNFGHKPVGGLHKESGGPGVNAQLVDDGEFPGEELLIRQFFHAYYFAHFAPSGSGRI
jgi:hypothetical protein